MAWGANSRAHHQQLAPPQQLQGLGITQAHGAHSVPTALRPSVQLSDRGVEQMQARHGGAGFINGGMPVGGSRGGVIEMHTSGNDAFNGIFGGGKDWHTTHTLSNRGVGGHAVQNP